MVDALVSFAIEKLGGFSEDELKLLCGTREEVDKLSITLQMILPCLHDAEMRQFNEPEVGVWLKKLKYVAYEADDVLDKWQTAKTQQRSMGANPVWNFFVRCTCFHQLALRHSVGKKIQKINSKLDDIDTCSKKFNFLTSPSVTNVIGKGTNFPSVIRNARQTTSSVEEIFGREDEINSIKELINSSETSKLAVVSIVGPAGFGKTTLAKYLFNDGEIVKHFKERIWVCVSDEFEEASIMRKIIEAATKVAPSVVELEALRKIVVDEILKDKLFLLVLDDVWNEEYGKWEKLFDVIKNCGLNGSRIVVTTRSGNVCNVIDGHIFRLRSISSFEHCWSIFESVAFGSKNKSKCPKLREVGKEIVRKCKGVPLAIKTVAGALRNKNKEDDWKIVLQSNMWDWQPKAETGILPALLLSYYHLSPPLKQCFQYCAIYPKDYYIFKDEIVPQWIAHGYILEKKNMEMEDVGEDYFDELVGRSLFQEPELDEYDTITHCKMHDLVHDLAQFVTKGEFLDINNEENIEFDAQYPPLHCNVSNMESLNNIKIDVENMRTFVLSSYYGQEYYMRDSEIEKMQHLRVLELENWSCEELPVAMGKLVHLRYLKVRNTISISIMKIPSLIGKLQNLQYLGLLGASIEALPESVKDLRKLRHLDLSSNENLTALPSTIGRLTNLRKLYLKGTRLDEIPDCIGKLCLLRYLNLARTQIRGLPESIGDLSRLQVLDVFLCKKLEKLPAGIFNKMTGLKQLCVSYSGLQGLPAGIGKLTRLQSLKSFWVFGNLDGSSSSSTSSSNICELADLNHLQPYLAIYNLDMVTSGEEAARAQLHDKNFLTHLRLEWNTDGREGAKEKTSEDVLQALRPCPTLPQLEIIRYPGCTVPTWLGDSTTRMLSGLQQLRLEGWDEFTNLLELDGCTNLSALGNLPELRRLHIRGMPKVRRVGAKQGFLKLEYLGIWNMAEWEEWGLKENLFFTFPCLIELEIYDCPKLQSLPPIFSTSLREIHVHRCPNLNNWLGILPPSVASIPSISAEWVNEMPSLPNLQCLHITGDDGVSELSNHLIKLGTLERLEIQDCPNLESLPQEMASLKQLQTLKIYNCGKIQSLPSLPNLECLDIGGDDGVSELSNHLVKLGALKTLWIRNCPNLESLPQEMTPLKQLQTLYIYNCGKLRSLPSFPNLEHLTISGDDRVSELSNDLGNKLGALKRLYIKDCPNLESLPEEMASLKQLQTLEIHHCPKLEESCNKEGAQWYKIQHIPNIMIDREHVSRNA